MKKLLGNLAVIMISVMVAALAGEGILRVIGYSNPSFYRGDPCCGASLRPGAEGRWTREGNDYVIINSQGLRDREHEINKPSNTFRIAVLGDSYSEALQLPMEKAFWSVLERKLQNQCPALGGKRVEVINFGVSGYGTAQELQTLRHKVWHYDPDFILLAFLTGNDVRNNYRALEQDPLRPYFLLKDGELVLDDSFLQEPAYRIRVGWKFRLLSALLDHSRLFQLFNDVRQRFKAMRVQSVQAKGAGNDSEAGLDNMIYSPPATKAWREAWRVTEALIKRMSEEVQAKGATFLVVTLSNGVQVLPDKESRKRFMDKFGIDDLFYPDNRIARFAEKNGIPVITLAPDLQQWAENNDTCVHGFQNASPCGGHWNENGHRVAGELIAGHLCKMLDGKY